MNWESPGRPRPGQSLPLLLWKGVAGEGKGGNGNHVRSCHISCWCVLWVTSKESNSLA